MGELLNAGGDMSIDYRATRIVKSVVDPVIGVLGDQAGWRRFERVSRGSVVDWVCKSPGGLHNCWGPVLSFQKGLVFLRVREGRIREAY